MKKLTNTAFYYAIAAMVAGVFYREFTKIMGFDTVINKTSLAFVHTHLFMLGMFFILVLALFADRYPITTHRKFTFSLRTYNIGVIGAAATFVWRGVLQVLGSPLSSGLNASISGVSGIFHIILAVGMLMLLNIIRKSV